MSNTSRNKSNIIRVAAFIAPVLVVQSTHRMLATPPPLTATQTEDPLVAVAFAAPKATIDQVAAIDRAGLLTTFELENTPFYYARAIKPTVAFHPGNPDAPAEFDTDSVRVSSISGSGTNIFAVINGTVCQVGDEVAKGIVVQSIDPLERTVTLTAQGKPIALTLVDPLAD